MPLENAEALNIRMEGIGNQFENPDLQNAFEDIREVVLASIQSNFDSSSHPTSGPWPPRQDNLPHPLLIKSGALMRAATGKGPGHITSWLTDGFEVGVDTSVKLGGIPGARRHNQGGGGIPQREFLAVSEEAAAETRKILIAFMKRSLENDG